MRKQLLLLLSLFYFSFSVEAQLAPLSEQAEISLLTCDVNTELYAMYGHSAIRVCDAAQQLDVVFNYGLFSFSKPHFVYRFAQGRTDYLLGAQSFDSFYRSYQQMKRSISEQKLLLHPAEKQKLVDFLCWNVQPEHAEYRYNFLYDNCATRVRDAIERCVDGEIIYGEKLGKLHTFRQLVDSYQQVSPWVNFGIHLLLGSPTDIGADAHEQLFLPPYLEAQYAQSKVKREREEQPLCQPVAVIYEAPPKKLQSKWIMHMPSIVMGLLLFFFTGLSVCQWRSRQCSYRYDYLWLIIHGIIGFILLWFFFFSELPAMKRNYNMIWACAFHLPFAFLWMKKSWRSTGLRFYWHVSTLCSVGFLLLAAFLPQAFPLPIYLLVAMAAVRSCFIISQTSGAQKKG